MEYSPCRSFLVLLRHRVCSSQNQTGIAAHFFSENLANLLSLYPACRDLVARTRTNPNSPAGNRNVTISEIQNQRLPGHERAAKQPATIATGNAPHHNGFQLVLPQRPDNHTAMLAPHFRKP